MKVSQRERDEAIASLKRYLSDGSRVYMYIGNVARSGMSRSIFVYAMGVEHKSEQCDYSPECLRECYIVRPQWLNGWISKVLGLRMDKRQGLIVSGCGMDMTLCLQDALSHALGFKLTREVL